MSDFDYKANYDAARDRAKELIESKKTFISRESLEYIFPELKPHLPDKIYIQENDPSMRYGVNQDANIKGMHEYICKDKVLEILSDSKHLADAALKIDEL